MGKTKPKAAKVKEVKEVKKAKAVKPEKPPKAVKAPKEKEAKAPKAEKPTAVGPSKAALRKISEEDEQNLKKWQKLQKQYSDDTPLTYSISGFFDVKMPLQHKVHGWGVVLNRRENYIDVLFESGMKTLIMNVK